MQVYCLFEIFDEREKQQSCQLVALFLLPYRIPIKMCVFKAIRPQKIFDVVSQ